MKVLKSRIKKIVDHFGFVLKMIGRSYNFV